MAEASRELSARIGAVRICLADAKGTPVHDRVSSLQRAALADILQREQPLLSAGAKASVAEQLLQIDWAGQDGAFVLNVLQAGNAGKYASTRRQ